MKLTEEKMKAAVAFMKTKARRLEKAIYEYEFEAEPFSAVIRELAHFQNEDGGFGHGLEPDLRCEASSALATTRALEILSLNEEYESIPMVKRALQYFDHTYDPELKGWDIIPKEAELSPRAVWWKYGVFREYWGNANADIISAFIDYQQEYDWERLDRLVDYALDYFMNTCDLTEMHELFCYLHLAERLTDEQKQRTWQRLEQFAENCVNTNIDDREGYGATPLQVVDSPSSLFYNKYAEIIPRELDLLIEQQAEDGSWHPNWSWYQYEEDWPAAKQEWQGILTLQALRILRNFGQFF